MTQCAATQYYRPVANTDKPVIDDWYSRVANHVQHCTECTDMVFCAEGAKILNSGPMGEIPAMDLQLPGDLDEKD